jgi:hypothetical protein
MALSPRLKKRVREINAERQRLSGRIGVLAKEAKARTITVPENEELIRLRRRHQDLGRKVNAITRNGEFDPFALARSRASGKRGPQGPSGGIRSVAQGGSPGSGKRS